MDVLLNCGNAAVKLLDLIRDAFELILAAFYVFSSGDGFVDKIQHPFVQRVDAAREQVDFLRTAIYADSFSNGGFHKRQVCGLVLRMKAPQRSDNGPMQGFFLRGDGVLTILFAIVQTADATPDDFLFSADIPCDTFVPAAALCAVEDFRQSIL